MDSIKNNIFLESNECLECKNNDTCFCINFGSEKECYCLVCVIETFKNYSTTSDIHKCVSCNKNVLCMKLQEEEFYLCLTCILVMFDDEYLKEMTK
jgi:hypothetical protein